MHKAVIEIGSTGTRLIVVETTDTDGQEWEVIDRSAQPVPLGRDVFTTGFVSKDTMLRCLQILNRYKEQVRAWDIPPQDITVIATSALRAAKNRDAVLDRIMTKTGFRVEVIDSIQQNRLMYLAVRDCFRGNDALLEQSNAIILKVGGGGTDLMLIAQGHMAGVHTLKLGTVIIDQYLKSIDSLRDTYRFLEDYIRIMQGFMDHELSFSNISQFVALGQEAQIMAKSCGKRLSPRLWQVPKDSFSQFVDDMQGHSVEECVARFKISYGEAQNLHIGLMIYKFFLQFTHAETLLVPETSTREGYLLSKTIQPNQMLMEDFISQVTASAWILARKYKVDTKHARCVQSLSLKLFDQLKDELGLRDETRILLEIAAILHDIGMFVGARDHNVHSSYIISNSDIFGLNRDQIDMISQIAHNHRGNLLPQEHPRFVRQDRESRITVLKLSALLRIAEALDRGHTQKIQDFSIDFHPDTLIIRCKDSSSVALERQSLSEKANLFESIFGYKVILG